MAQRVKNLPAMEATWVQSLDQEDVLEKEMATHSGILVWRIPWPEGPVGLQSMGSQKVRHNWVIMQQYTEFSSLQPWIEMQTKCSPSLALKSCFFSFFPLTIKSCKWSCQERYREVLFGHHPPTPSGDILHDCSVIVKPGGCCCTKPQRRGFTL